MHKDKPMGLVATSSALLLLLLSLVPSCVSDDQLSPGKPLVFPNDKLISNNGFFALGLFSPTNSSTHSYLGIWYNNDPERRVVWVGNRDNPITTSSSATLTVTNRSELVLSDGEGRIYWSTEGSNTTAPSTGGAAGAGGAASVQLVNQGNLVLRSSNGTVLWQSFDHPTDTIVANMPFRMNYRTRSSQQRLVSWKGPADPSSGDFSVGGEVSSGIQFFIWHGPNVTWRSSPLSSGTVGSYQPSYASSVIITSFIVNGDDISLSFSVPDGSPGVNGRITYAGKFEFRTWNSAASSWTLMEVLPGPGCNRYAACGPFSYCDAVEAVPTCKCLDGFEPRGSSPSAGCSRKKPLECGVGDRFVAVPHLKKPATPEFVGNRTFNGCAAECVANCSCTAYAYANMSTTIISGGDSSRCLLWFGDLLDMGKYAQVMAGQDLYVRLASSDEKKSNLVKIVLPIVACLLLVTCTAFFWIWRRRGKRQKKVMIEYSRSMDEAGGENMEFPIIRFEDIVTATDNFSDFNVLGMGGFGKVYKGMLEGTNEVAIKRLGKGSGQGTAEFRNEVALIAKLQHKNLVKLLGCCIHEDEQLLVYEYLPNKSLDHFIFDSKRKSMLPWPTRFKIIQGVARGILYLHQDSRLTIIHRDLKASNILLDKEMNPKISDFGMARIFCGNQLQANTNRVVGTYGYMSPEYAMEGAFSIKSDTYSFGVLLLETVSGLRVSSSPHLIMNSRNLIACAWNLWKDDKIEDFMDSSVKESSLDEVSRCVQIGLLCVQDSPNCRPLMSAVVFMLENRTTPLPTPKKPVYFAHRFSEPGTSGDNGDSSMNDISLTVIEGR